MIDLIGKKFGKLLVISKTDERFHASIVWECLCDCGEIKKVDSHALISNRTKSCGCHRKERFSVFAKEQCRNYRIQKGMDPDTPMSDASVIERGLFKATGLVRKIMLRDNFTCQLCLKPSSGNLQVHHLVPWADSIALRYEETNLVTLCKKCHKKAHGGSSRGKLNLKVQEALQNKIKSAL